MKEWHIIPHGWRKPGPLEQLDLFDIAHCYGLFTIWRAKRALYPILSATHSIGKSAQ